MTNYDSGIYVLTVYASAAQVDRTKVIENYKSRYSASGIESLGAMSKGVNYSVLKQKFMDLDDGENPSRVDLNDVLLKVGGSTIGIGEAVKLGVEDSAKGIFSGLKVLIIAVVVIGGAYILWETGAIRALKKSHA